MGRTGKGRATIVLSSDDEDCKEQPPTPSHTEENGSQSRILPTRSRKPMNRRKDTLTAKPNTQIQQGKTSKGTNGAIPLLNTSSTTSKAKDPTKTGNRTLYSFFNTATQKQQSQFPSSPEKEDSAEAIEDDIDEDDSRSTSTSHTQNEAAAVARKRTRSSLGRSATADELDSAPTASQKFLKTQDGTRAPSICSSTKNAIQIDERPWTEKYCPLSLDELAVHKKKVSDVTQWLKGVFAGQDRKRLLVMKGPAGSAKTTMLLLLAKALKFDLTEWKNPSVSDFTSGDYVSVLAQFEDFIGRSGRFGTLEFGPVDGDARKENAYANANANAGAQSSGREAILIEEFPNTFMRSTSALHAFRSTIRQYLAVNTPSLASLTRFRPDDLDNIEPMIMIISETHISTGTSIADSFTAARLLGPEILHHPGTSVIEFKPIAPTILIKALELVVVKEARQTGRRRTPGPQILKALAETGDIRSAISTIEFLCVRGDEGDAWSGKIAFTKPKRAPKESSLTKMEQESLKMITNRGSNLDVFHGLGKVLYNKRQDPSPDERGVTQPPSHFPQHRRLKVPENDVDGLLDEIGADIETFVSGLHENYVLSCHGLTVEDTLDCVDACSESLSDADLLGPSRFSSHNRNLQNSASDSLRQDEISFHVSVRGLLFALPSPVKRSAPPPATSGGWTKKFGQQDAFKMFFPASIKLWRRREELEDLIEYLVTMLQRGRYFWPTMTVGSASIFAQSTVLKSTSHTGHVKPSEDEASQTRMGSGDSAKIEGLLEHLPYLAILQKSRGTLANVQELEDVTRFRGVGLVTEDDEEDELHNASKEPAMPTGVEQKVDKLILSDDDIED